MQLLNMLNMNWFLQVGLVLVGLVAATPIVVLLSGMRFIANTQVGLVEKLWSADGSVGEGHLIVVGPEAGYQARVLRGGLHFGYWCWQYRIHRVPLTVVSQGKIGYVFARDGEPLPPEQTLGRVVPCNHFQDAAGFLGGNGPENGSTPRGQRGRQRAILREGVYAINLALFVVITEDRVYRLMLGDSKDDQVSQWHRELLQVGGFRPVVVGGQERAVLTEASDAETPEAAQPQGDTIGIITVHDGPTLDPGEIIAPAVGRDATEPHYHNNYQDIEAFLRAGGRRGRQLVPLTDGTYFINRWFATVELIPKTLVPIGSVGVVVSYYGKQGQDLSGESFRHGERVAEGSRGVQTNTLSPGKYPFNTYAGRVHLVPTTNFVLHWITGRTEMHRYDESLKSIDLVTADAYEPVLPLSVVVHLDYQKAPAVIQRFGDIKKLITQTLDPMLSAYFRDIAHKKTMLELLHDRDLIQQEARGELRHRFAEFDIELVDVLIGKPETQQASGQIETLLEQLRTRQLSREQLQTYQEQCAAAEKLQILKRAQAEAEKQTELTNSRVEIEIAGNRAEAELLQARKRAEQTVVTAEADGKSRALVGEGESKRISLQGEAEAEVLRKKIVSYADPRLYALAVISQYLAESKQPLVPSHLLVTGAAEGAASGQGLLGTLVSMLLAEKVGWQGPSSDGQASEAATIAPSGLVAKR